MKPCVKCPKGNYCRTCDTALLKIMQQERKQMRSISHARKCRHCAVRLPVDAYFLCLRCQDIRLSNPYAY